MIKFNRIPISPIFPIIPTIPMGSVAWAKPLNPPRCASTAARRVETLRALYFVKSTCEVTCTFSCSCSCC